MAAVEPHAADERPIALETLAAGTGENALLAAAGALPAWVAVLERGRLLARRGERGAVWGRVAPEVEGSLWLLDESGGAPGLGIRLAGAGRALAVGPGRRVVAWGAWAVDDERRWVWRAERLAALSEVAADTAGRSRPAPVVAPLPGRLVSDLPAPPDGAMLPSEHGKAGPLLFAVVAAPIKPGDGWAIADRIKGPPSAVLLLPGEAPIHGGLDYLSPDERWALEPGQWYAAPATAPSKPPRPGDLPVLRARAAPARVPAPPPAPLPRRR